MKRILTITLLILPLIFLASCGKPAPKNPGTTLSMKIEDFFPLKKNIHYTYVGKGNEYAGYSLYVDYLEGARVQQRIDNGGTEQVRVLEAKNGKLTRLFSRGEIYYRENMLKAPADNPEVLLMEPLQKGTTWTLKDGRVRTITDTAAKVTTPLGSYQAIQVVTKGPDDQTTDYYARNLGLVKSVFSSKGGEVTSALAAVEEHAPFVQRITFYYPNLKDNKLTELVRTIPFRTNNSTLLKLQAAYSESSPANTGKVFTPHTRINSLYLNSNNVVCLDLNQAFLTEMNAGSGYEAMILQSLANTFGHYYGVNKVQLTIDKKPYESGHILLKPGEYLQVK